MHFKIVAIIGYSKGIFSVEVNKQLMFMKLSPLISDELHVDLLFESQKHYDIKINISLSLPYQTSSIFLQSSASISSEILEQSCFACTSESSSRPIHIQVVESAAPLLSSFDCNVQFITKYDHAMEGSSL
jgi:hypothetical protein